MLRNRVNPRAPVRQVRFGVVYFAFSYSWFLMLHGTVCPDGIGRHRHRRGANLLWRARASLLLADKLVGRRRPDVLPAVGVLDSLLDAEGGHHDDGDGDDPSEQKHDVSSLDRPRLQDPYRKNGRKTREVR